jgi:hypothetical protein
MLPYYMFTKSLSIKGIVRAIAGDIRGNMCIFGHFYQFFALFEAYISGTEPTESLGFV